MSLMIQFLLSASMQTTTTTMIRLTCFHANVVDVDADNDDDDEVVDMVTGVVVDDVDDVASKFKT